MDKEVVISAGFTKQLNKTYNYLLNEWSAQVAYEFIEKVWQKVKFIEQHQSLGNLPKKGNSLVVCLYLPIIEFIFVLVNKDIYCVLVRYASAPIKKSLPIKNPHQFGRD